MLQPIKKKLRLLLPALRCKHVGVCENEEPSGVPKRGPGWRGTNLMQAHQCWVLRLAPALKYLPTCT